ncbi:MAG TPA: glucose 1-dehydrogenase [Phenylobacterium sp.]|uniref:SDR family NAD(P)-dependent oxidoreductase n=1 Tax=Phenylobacterium sp. TaxID=1871053 RepID=UPI002B4760E0|nr:glucose 1-dehydrogenase [Phenylobacterium sp.]HKR89314.1 glucose 1-dehydrogenase [Phenylobacterium sp.]
MQLSGKVAIVTGASTGLGRAIAGRYAAEGAAVVVADINDPEPAVAEILEAGGVAVGQRVDVASEDQVTAMVAEVISRFGQIDVLVNNAAVSASLKQQPFEDIDLHEWRKVMDVNVLGVFLCIRAVTPSMRARRSGSIINIGSGTAIKALPRLTHYVASKAAVHVMTRSLARELGVDNITINAIAPGYFLTEGNLGNPEFLALQRDIAVQNRSIPRDAYPDDLTGAAVFFAGDQSRFITGQILPVDGGSV